MNERLIFEKIEEVLNTEINFETKTAESQRAFETGTDVMHEYAAETLKSVLVKVSGIKKDFIDDSQPN